VDRALRRAMFFDTALPQLFCGRAMERSIHQLQIVRTLQRPSLRNFEALLRLY
jgi:hypothetical protein